MLKCKQNNSNQDKEEASLTKWNFEKVNNICKKFNNITRGRPNLLHYSALSTTQLLNLSFWHYFGKALQPRIKVVHWTNLANCAAQASVFDWSVSSYINLFNRVFHQKAFTFLNLGLWKGLLELTILIWEELFLTVVTFSSWLWPH